MTADEAELRAYYNQTLAYYTPLASTHLDLLFSLIDTPMLLPVLDVGCGVGWAARDIPYDQYLGVDYAAERVREARRRWPMHTFRVERLQDTLADEDGWGTVLMVEVLEHLEDPTEAVRLARLAGLQVVGTVPVDMPDPAHLTVFPDERAVTEMLHPSRIERVGMHWVLRW